MDTADEIPLEDHRYFLARLHQLKSRHPAALLAHLETGTLTEHLRNVTLRALEALQDMVINKNMPQDQADELVMSQIVADPQEQSQLTDRAGRKKLRTLLEQYEAALPDLPRTYQSESETTE